MQLKAQDMNYFTPDFLEFFKELAANNHKDWFDINRKRYANEVKEPFKKLVGDLINEIKSKHEPELLIEPKDAIFRINRDIRFAKDKTPYKTNLSALLSPRGRKNHAYSSFYFELGPERIAIFGGCYGPSSQELASMRQHLLSNYSRFDKLRKDKSFISHFPKGIEGEKQKRVPKEFKEWVEKDDVFLNKQFYYGAELDADIIPTGKLFQTLMKYYALAHPMMNFLREPF